MLFIAFLQDQLLSENKTLHLWFTQCRCYNRPNLSSPENVISKRLNALKLKNANGYFPEAVTPIVRSLCLKKQGKKQMS